MSKFIFLILVLISSNIWAAEYTVCFTPQQECRSKLINLINSTDKELKIAVFTLTNLEVSNAIISAKNRGVDVRIILDNKMSLGRGSKLEELKSSKIQIKTDKSHNYMHHKYIISDGKKLLSGSYNFSNNAERNWENFTISNDQELIKIYDSNFELLGAEV